MSLATEAGGKERSPPIPIQSKERGCRCRIFGDEEGYEGGGGAYLDYDDTTTSLFSGDSSTHGRVRVFVPMMVPFCISLRHYLYLGLIGTMLWKVFLHCMTKVGANHLHLDVVVELYDTWVIQNQRGS